VDTSLVPRGHPTVMVEASNPSHKQETSPWLVEGPEPAQP